jgi:hypothetical protein
LTPPPSDLASYAPYVKLQEELRAIDRRIQGDLDRLDKIRDQQESCRSALTRAEDDDAVDGGSRAAVHRKRFAELGQSITGIEADLNLKRRAFATRQSALESARKDFGELQRAQLNAEVKRLLCAVVPHVIETARLMGAVARLQRNAGGVGIQLECAHLIQADWTFALAVRDMATAYGIVHGETILHTPASRWLLAMQAAGYDVELWRDDELSAAEVATVREAQDHAYAAGCGTDVQARADAPKLAAGLQMASLARRTLALVGIRV